MKLSEPKITTFWISLLIAVLALILFFVPTTNSYAVWLALIAYVLLALGNVLKGL